jgi:7,8-dihydropterin-6-yl-methyl-4-(beta-D-ribofuranosyl)aminobenzene 5'-phosphate synthase
VRLHVVYDNNAADGYRAHWGFACLIDGEERVLFDTGLDPAVLQFNMEHAGIGPASIDRVVLSHDHDDHRDGLAYIAANNARAELFILPTFGPEARRLAGAMPIREVTEPCEVSPDMHSTGPVEGVAWEQALALETDRGIVLVVGCSHPGVDKLIGKARLFGDIHAVLGGFHDSDRLDALEGIPFVAPCHCTQRTAQIIERYPDAYHKIVAGTVLEF